MSQTQELKKGDVVLFIRQSNDIEEDDLDNQHTLCAGVVRTLSQFVGINLGCGLGLLVDRERVFSDVREALAAIVAMEQERAGRAEVVAKQARANTDTWFRTLEIF
jgi:hypothetical protein